ncbi:MAG: cob(I)yrinic acid a,c-diamide adenosyltransferase [Candidatus Micrarchaeia archaeon]|jgi:cob(I)alamin adenosyltransferase
MPKFYTGNGDKGMTSLVSYGNVPKDDPLVTAIGSVDELNSSIGVALFYTHNERIRKELIEIQNDLFILGADLACSLTKNKTSSVKKEQVERLEKNIGELGDFVGELKKFVLPGGCEGASHIQLSRAIARRAERDIVSAAKKYTINPEVIRYINRLSSYLFVAALYLNKLEGIEEHHPVY